MNLETLYQKLYETIFTDFKLDKVPFWPVELFRNGGPKEYYNLLAALFTVLPNHENRRFIDLLREKNPELVIENEHLGFLLHLLPKGNYSSFKSIQTSTPHDVELTNEYFDKLCSAALSQFTDEDRYYFLICLKRNERFNKYASWFKGLELSKNENHNCRANFERFLSLLFTENDRKLLDSLLILTEKNADFFEYAEDILRCFAWEDKHLNEKIIALTDALLAYIDTVDCDSKKVKAEQFNLAVNELEELLKNSPDMEFEKFRTIGRLVSNVLLVGVTIGMVVLAASVFLFPIAPAIACIYAAVIFIAATSALALRIQCKPQETASTDGQQILDDGKIIFSALQKQSLFGYQFQKDQSENWRLDLIVRTEP